MWYITEPSPALPNARGSALIFGLFPEFSTDVEKYVEKRALDGLCSSARADNARFTAGESAPGPLTAEVLASRILRKPQYYCIVSGESSPPLAIIGAPEEGQAGNHGRHQHLGANPRTGRNQGQPAHLPLVVQGHEPRER